MQTQLVQTGCCTAGDGIQLHLRLCNLHSVRRGHVCGPNLATRSPPYAANNRALGLPLLFPFRPSSDSSLIALALAPRPLSSLAGRSFSSPLPELSYTSQPHRTWSRAVANPGLKFRICYVKISTYNLVFGTIKKIQHIKNCTNNSVCKQLGSILAWTVI